MVSWCCFTEGAAGFSVAEAGGSAAAATTSVGAAGVVGSSTGAVVSAVKSGVLMRAWRLTVAPDESTL